MTEPNITAEVQDVEENEPVVAEEPEEVVDEPEEEPEVEAEVEVEAEPEEEPEVEAEPEVESVVDNSTDLQERVKVLEERLEKLINILKTLHINRKKIVREIKEL